jgi:hypothetical protein
MKKVKIMLMSLAVLAVVGAGLAFKAKTFSGDLKCSTEPDFCTLETFTTNVPIGEFSYCTTLQGNTRVCDIHTKVILDS